MEYDIGCNMIQGTHIPDPTLEIEPVSSEETQNTNMGSIYDKEISNKNSFISITDANDSTGSELLEMDGSVMAMEAGVILSLHHFTHHRHWRHQGNIQNVIRWLNIPC